MSSRPRDKRAMCVESPLGLSLISLHFLSKRAAEISGFFSRSWIGLPSEFCVCNSHKLCKLVQGKFAVGQGKQGI